MELNGTYTFNARQQDVWDTLMNPDAIAQALPGVKKMVPLDNESDAWRADVKIQVASIGGTYSGTIRMSDKVTLEQYRLTVSGEGQQSIINGSALISLKFDEEKAQTLLNWTAETSISGKLAGVGQRLIGAAADLMARRFFKSLAQQIPASNGPKAN